jgi:hypothetical protein
MFQLASDSTYFALITYVVDVQPRTGFLSFRWLHGLLMALMVGKKLEDKVMSIDNFETIYAIRTRQKPSLDERRNDGVD